jgi:streptogramin lyase
MGDILVADAGSLESQVEGGVLRVNPTSGAQTTVVFGQNQPISNPTGIVVEANGDLLVVDPTTSAVYRIDPASPQEQTTVSSGGSFVDPTGIALEANGDILIADGAAGVIAVDPTSGEQATISSGGSFANPTGIAVEANGNILVADGGAFGKGGGVIRVDPTFHRQTTVSSGGSFIQPWGIAVTSM